ncbi:MAG: flagellar hook-length control protein FliK [Pseudomonadota bacterium]
MEIKPTPSQISIPRQGATLSAPWLDTLRVGQVLEAKVIAKLGAEQYSIELQNTRLLIKSTTPLTEGQTIRLKLEHLTPQPEFKLVSAERDEPVAQALRHLMPKQAPLEQLLGQLQHIVKLHQDMPRLQAVLPEAALKLIRQLIANLPDTKQLGSAEGLKRALQDSGQFLEQKLAQAAVAQNTVTGLLDKDLKVALLNLARELRELDQRLQTTPAASLAREGKPAIPLAQIATAAAGAASPSPGADKGVSSPASPGPSQNGNVSEQSLIRELLRHAEASIARIQTQQLTTLPTPDDPKLVWTFELPLRHQERLDTVQLRIQRDGGHAQAAGAKPAWNVLISFELQTLGPVHVNLRMAGHALQAGVWTEHPLALQLFNRHLEELRQRLGRKGVNVEQLQCHRGKPPQLNSPPPPAARTLVDIQI